MTDASKSYSDYGAHNVLREHYVRGTHGGLYLGFCRQFKDEAMPLDMSGSGHKYELDIALVDARTGERATGHHVVAYEHPGWAGHQQTLLDQDWCPQEVTTLQHYFYSLHFCGCHRGNEMRKVGAKLADWDGECGYGQFHITSIVWDQRPGLILYSEVYDNEELETRLRELHAKEKAG